MYRKDKPRDRRETGLSTPVQSTNEYQSIPLHANSLVLKSYSEDQKPISKQLMCYITSPS